ncbi:MAG TPA: polyphosphate kinase 2 family protein [Elusimicrobiota bacterium]|jgi:PPK2 family polyphosphate:nucleotide phosphotransferase|nr:polyphosphate kinase 2 family protein [Elusimicrobiota bacterium]
MHKDPARLLLVEPGKGLNLAKEDPEATPGFHKDGKEKAKDRLADDAAVIDHLQPILYAENRRSLLVVFQAMDTGGKDGTIRAVLGHLNPQGVEVTSFKKPTPDEMEHDFLWRIHKAVPRKGTIGVFNRSQYEDILVPTVFKLFSKAEIEARYDLINSFERHLAENGTVILKFFLHISKEEQRTRLQARLDDKHKNWKFSEADVEMRAYWDAFQKVYGRMLARTSTPWAPWYLIPANKKWYRNAAVARIVRETLEGMRLRYPPPPKGLGSIVIPE